MNAPWRMTLRFFSSKKATTGKKRGSQNCMDKSSSKEWTEDDDIKQVEKGFESWWVQGQRYKNEELCLWQHSFEDSANERIKVIAGRAYWRDPNGEHKRLLIKENLPQALDMIECMRGLEGSVPLNLLFIILQACIESKDWVTGRRLEAFLVSCGFEKSSYFSSHLIRMFALSGSIMEARGVFWRLAEPSEFAWAAIISAHAKLGHEEEAILLYCKMYSSGVKLDGHVFVFVLQACVASLDINSGKLIHAHLCRQGFCLNVYIGNALIDMYAKCGSLEDCNWVFDHLSNRDMVTWSVMISAYAGHGNGTEAFQLFKLMLEKGMTPDNVVFASVFKACAMIGDLCKGEMVHETLKASGLEPDSFVESALIDMYVNCGSLDNARRVFKALPQRSLVTWNAIIVGLSENEHGHEALRLYKEMIKSGVEPDNVTFLGLAKAGACIRNLNEAMSIHIDIMRCGYESNIFIGNSLIGMYANCGSIDDARSVFDHMEDRSVATWNAMIAGYTQNEQGHEALDLYDLMTCRHIEPDAITFVCVLKACSGMTALDHGRIVHTDVLTFHQELNSMIGNALLDMYAKCGALRDTVMVFRKLTHKDVIAWTSFLQGLAQYGNYSLAMRCLDCMQQEDANPQAVAVLASYLGAANDGLNGEFGRSHEKNATRMENARLAKSFIEIRDKIHVFFGGDIKDDDIYAKAKREDEQVRMSGHFPSVNLVQVVLDEKNFVGDDDTILDEGLSFG